MIPLQFKTLSQKERILQKLKEGCIRSLSEKVLSFIFYGRKIRLLFFKWNYLCIERRKNMIGEELQSVYSVCSTKLGKMKKGTQLNSIERKMYLASRIINGQYSSEEDREILFSVLDDFNEFLPKSQKEIIKSILNKIIYSIRLEDNRDFETKLIKIKSKFRMKFHCDPEIFEHNKAVIARLEVLL